MNSKTIANEYTHLFYIKLKHKRTINWYLSNLNDKISDKKKFPKSLLKKELSVNQITFFKKHVWYYFEIKNVSGWIYSGNVRKSYCRLNVPLYSLDDNNLVNAIYMLLKYKNHFIDYDDIISELNYKKVLTPRSLSNLVINNTGTFKDISNKPVHRIKNQILRCRPVMIWGSDKLNTKLSAIIVTGFNHRLFFYNDPVKEELRVISKSKLLKYWKISNFLAISY